MKNGILYVVGTPIGNLEDISCRAIRILKEVSLIAAEDTRHTKKLLNHFNIHTPLESYHKFNEKQKLSKLIKILTDGKNIALVSNAGMPGISDPGELLVKEAIKNNIQIIPIPGPSALILALAISGLSTKRFIFEGFLPKKKGLRIKTLYSLKEEERTLIFYESGKRLKSTLLDIQKTLGIRNIVIARELTKKFEEILRGKTDIILKQSFEKPIRGELVLLVEGSIKKPVTQELPLKEEITLLQDQLGVTAKEAIKLVAGKLDIPKRKIYNEWIKPR